MISLNRGPVLVPNQGSVQQYGTVRFRKAGVFNFIFGSKKSKKVSPEKIGTQEYVSKKSENLHNSASKSLFDTKTGFMSKIVERVKDLENSLFESGRPIKIGDRVDSDLIVRTCSDKRSLLKNTFLAVGVLPVFLLSRFYRWLAPSPNLVKAVRNKAEDAPLPFALEKKTYFTKKMAGNTAVRHLDTLKADFKRIANLNLQYFKNVFRIPFDTGHKSLLFVYTNNVQDAKQLVEAAEKNNNKNRMARTMKSVY